MSFPRQDSVMSRLQSLNVSEVSKAALKHKRDVMVLWARAARLLKADIAAAYSGSAQRGERWDLTMFHASGNYHRFAARSSAVLGDFTRRSTWRMREAFRDIKDLSGRRQAWALSQVVPHPERIKIYKDRIHAAHEAKVPLTVGFAERWAEKVGAYHSALVNNLRLNALNSGALADAVDEVDATRMDTPAFTMDATLDRIWEYEAWDAMTEGMTDVADLNDEAEEEIWRTSGDLRVCDDCDENEGLPLDEADGTIPLHPNCNCFYQLVPASFAALLRSGDEGDRDLARQMDFEGVAPNAIVIRGPKGDIKGRAIVDFDNWDEARGLAVAGR